MVILISDLMSQEKNRLVSDSTSTGAFNPWAILHAQYENKTSDCFI